MTRSSLLWDAERREVSELLARLDSLNRQRVGLFEQKHRLLRQMVARIRNVSVESVSILEQPSQLEREIEATIAHHQAICESRLLAESDIGRRILELRQWRAALTGSLS